MLDRLAYQFIRPFPFGEKVAFFRKVFYLFLLINALSLLPIAYELFGYHGVVGTGGWNTAVPWYKQGSRVLINFLSHPINAGRPWIMFFFVYGQILALILGLLKVWPRLMAVLIYFLTANLFVKGYLAFTGGEALMSLLLFYLMFIQDPSTKSKGVEGEAFLQNVLNNAFYWIIILQIIILYLFSTLYKLTDPYWLDGSAMMYIARVDAFSGSSMRFLFSDSPILSLIVTYLVLLYQGLFPVFVWIKPLKKQFLMLGVALHLGIAFGMGIFTFGIIMCLVYLLFIDEKLIQQMRNHVARFFERFKG